MTDTPYTRFASPFLHSGIDLNHPSDLLTKGRSPLAINVRGYTEGVINQRPGLTAINGSAIADTFIHGGRVLNNPLPTAAQSYAVFIGAGHALYSDNVTHDVFTARATGYSGNPLCFIPATPAQSPEPYMYVGDSLKLTKSKVDGTTRQWGVTPPIDVPAIALTAPQFKTIDDFGAATFGGWAASAGVLTNPDRLAAVVINNLLYDTGSTGWALVNPAVFTDIREGMFVTMSVNAETVPIDSIYKAVTTTTIGSIKYDVGTSGACTIQLAAPTAELTINSMLRLAAAENVRVLSVTYGPDGIPSFRCVTTGTRAAGDAVVGLNAFRAYFANTHTTADTLSTKMIQLVTAGAGITTVTRTVAIDLSTVNSRPLTNDDYIAIQIQIDNPALIDKDIQVVLDIDGATNDFTRNYFWYAIRASDVQPSATQTLADLTVQQRVVQRQQLDVSDPNAAVQRKLDQLINNQDLPFLSREEQQAIVFDQPAIGDNSEPPITQTTPGLSQWTVFYIPVGNFQRAGSDTSRGWKDVQALRVSFSATAVITVKVDAWWAGGTYGPNTLSNQDAGRSPYFYVYRYRASESGAKSAPSPPNRSGIDVARGSIMLTPTVSADPQVDKIDWFRFGGTINSYTYIGTQANSGTFIDTQADDSLDLTPQAKLPIDGDGISLDLQPFPVIDLPRTGTVSVAGTEVTWLSGDTFNMSWIRNNQIIIAGVPYTLYAAPASSTRLSLNENAGTQAVATFYLPGAIIQGTPLDAYFGTWGAGEAGVTVFGVKDGTLYWTNGNDPDSCAKGNRLDVTSASEPLMNGCVYDGRPFLFSTERMWEVQPNQLGFSTQIIAYGKGLYARWGVTVGDAIYYIYKDGVYKWPADAGISGNMTDDQLYPYLPHEGQPGILVNNSSPPSFVAADTRYLRLSYSDSQLYFDYRTESTAFVTLVHQTDWIGFDQYLPNINCHFGGEGPLLHRVYACGDGGRLYRLDVANLIDGVNAPFSCTIRTPSINAGDARALKLIGDGFIELSAAAGESVVVTPSTENYTTSYGPTAIVGTGSRAQALVPLPQVPQTEARNLGLSINWSSIANATLYNWEYTFIARPENTSSRATDLMDCGVAGCKYFQGIRLRADTFGINRTITVRYTDDNGDEVVGATLSINHDGQSIKDYAFDHPFYGYLIRLVPDTLAAATQLWQLYDYTWDFNPAPERGTTWETPDSSLGQNGYFHLHRAFIAYNSTSTITMRLHLDGASVAASSYTIPSSGGEYRKVPMQLLPTKCKTLKVVFTSSSPFRIFQQDIEFLGKGWGSSAPFASWHIAGGPNNTVGAQI